MGIGTLGFRYYVDYFIPLTVKEGVSSLEEEESNKSYKAIIIKSGTTHFIMNNREFILTGSYAICMNELDRITFVDVNPEEVKILYFHPTVINCRFTFDVLNHPNRKLSSTEGQDTFFLIQFSKETDTSAKILSLHTIDATGIDYKIHLLQELLTKQDMISWPCRSRSYLFEILFCLSRQDSDEIIDNRMLYEGGSNMVKDIIYYIQSCYDKKITIEQLADVFHTNRTTLVNDFKSYTGQTVNRYVVEQRLMMAAKMLRDTSLSVDEICVRTGFNEGSYFCRVFKKKLSYTPSEYRRIAQCEKQPFQTI